MRLLMDYDWPGNVRELENLIKRTVVLGTEAPIRKEIAHGLAMAAARQSSSSAVSRRSSAAPPSRRRRVSVPAAVAGRRPQPRR